MGTKRIKLWDFPIRVFHWLLVLLITSAIITGEVGGSAIEWHGRIGLCSVGLIAFRLVWGVIGSTYARFVNFVPGSPKTVKSYLEGQWHGVGHNPLGAFSVLGLLGLIALQVGTGLFSNDDIAFNGPLFQLVSKELSDTITGIHEEAVGFLFGLIMLHIAAIIFYAHVKKESLVRPMITGWKEVTQDVEPAKGGGVIAFIVALLIALAAVYGGSGIWISASATPPEETQEPPIW